METVGNQEKITLLLLLLLCFEYSTRFKDLNLDSESSFEPGLQVAVYKSKGICRYICMHFIFTMLKMFFDIIGMNIKFRTEQLF